MKLTKVRLTDALKAARHFGYTGGDDDQKAIRESILPHAAGINIAGGDEVDWATVEFETDQPRKTYSFAPTAISNAAIPGTLPEGSDAKIEAIANQRVNDRLKALGLIDAAGNARPAIDPNQPRVSVKSVEEAYYEAKVRNGQATFKDYNTAKGAAHWLMANVLGKSFPALQHYNEPHAKALRQWAEHNKLDPAAVEFKRGDPGDAFGGKAFASNVYNQGAPLVPLIFMPDLIRLVNEYGAIRRLISPIRMPGQELILPRRTGGLTMYYPAENAAPTQSNITTNNVTLRAKTGMVLTVCSVQSLDDSGIDLADLVYKELALAIANGEDEAAFNGDGTGTYGGIVGLTQKFSTGTTGNAAQGGGTAAAHSLDNLWAAIGRLPDYARKNMKIACTPQMADFIFSRLSTSTGVGGLLRQELTGAGFTLQFFGIPIVTNNSMRSASDSGAGTLDFVAGDFSLAGKMGDRMQVELAMDMSRGFDTYSAYFRGVTRFDVNWHDVGTSSAIGPLISFWQT